MVKKMPSGLLLVCFALSAVIGIPTKLVQAQINQGPVGIFDGHSDVGPMYQPSSVQYDAAKGTYTVTAAGTNMWSAADAFHFVWKQVSGDVSLAADATFPTKSGPEHRKAVLIIRQTLLPDSVYADAALHGNGLTALQYRTGRGELSYDIKSEISGPSGLRIEKRGETITMWVRANGGEFRPSGSIKLALREPFYVGIGVCSHNKESAETAVFSNVEFQSLTPGTSAQASLGSRHRNAPD